MPKLNDQTMPADLGAINAATSDQLDQMTDAKTDAKTDDQTDDAPNDPIGPSNLDSDGLPIVGPVPQDLTDNAAIAAYLASVQARTKAVKAKAKADADKAKADAKAAKDAAKAAKQGTGQLDKLAAAQAKLDKLTSDAALLGTLIPVWAKAYDDFGGNAPRGSCKAIRAVAELWTHDRALFIKAGSFAGIDPTTLGCQWAAAKRT